MSLNKEGAYRWPIGRTSRTNVNHLPVNTEVEERILHIAYVRSTSILLIRNGSLPTECRRLSPKIPASCTNKSVTSKNSTIAIAESTLGNNQSINQIEFSVVQLLN